MFGKFSVHAWSQCGGLHKEYSISVHCGPNSFWHLLACQNEFDPQWIDKENSYSNIHTDSKYEPKAYQTWEVLYAEQPTPDQKSIELTYNSIVMSKMGQKSQPNHELLSFKNNSN